jgi:alpha-amylase
MWNGNEHKLFDYQNYVDGVFNFPMKYAIKEVFGSHKASMRRLSDKLNSVQSLFKDIDALGLFVDNHDEARFLFECN